ncbi:MAG TPA: hypothetical protein VF861_11205 [Telluria sp.]
MTFGREIPLERPDPGQRAAVFVPHKDAEPAVLEALKNGSGVAGYANSDRTVTVYFENNKFHDQSLEKWESKVFRAYERMVRAAPTVNKLTCDLVDMVQVGLIEGPEIVVLDMAALGAWLQRSGAPDSAPGSPLIHA